MIDRVTGYGILQLSIIWALVEVSEIGTNRLVPTEGDVGYILPE